MFFVAAIIDGLVISQLRDRGMAPSGSWLNTALTYLLVMLFFAVVISGWWISWTDQQLRRERQRHLADAAPDEDPESPE